ncbi:hypothetical protein BDK51DRAFT_46967 [Blyttiomyces helicus]|uniref:Uncharacterized protein n=1 Tax=Blyttiomyces helicus TaxID=388810 RepID=A0A4P9WM73_9FUNG|nr:hypothetical protein BDK51DRAFT_46967 [Blyttiomyces helicus]|eukprot:RKO92768.1 hypothetical protein BDK51DRAFT_46967 [Blyttiomyces helicus]
MYLGDPKSRPLICFNVALHRVSLYAELHVHDLPFAWDKERAIADWVCWCLIIRNQFLPPMPTLEHGEGTLQKPGRSTLRPWRRSWSVWASWTSSVERVYTQALIKAFEFYIHGGDPVEGSYGFTHAPFASDFELRRSGTNSSAYYFPNKILDRIFYFSHPTSSRVSAVAMCSNGSSRRAVCGIRSSVPSILRPSASLRKSALLGWRRACHGGVTSRMQSSRVDVPSGPHALGRGVLLY